jgi:hypothetical protein
MKGYRTEPSQGGCYSADSNQVCAFDGSSLCNTISCEGIIYVKIKRKPRKRGKVLAKGWMAQCDDHGLVISVTTKPVWFTSNEVTAGWCNKRVNIVAAEAK